VTEQPEARDGPGLRWFRRRSLQTLRHEGLSSFLLRTAAFLGYWSGIWYVGWYVRRLDTPIEPVKPGFEVRVTEMVPDNVGEYLQFQSNLSREEYLDRLRHSQICFAVRDSAGTLASITWTAVGRVRIEFVGREVALQEDEVYLYDSYTDPDFRGKRLQPFLCGRILTRFRNSGYRQAVVLIAPENRSNIASRMRSGFVRTGWLIRIKTSWLRRDFFRGVR